MAVIVKLSQNDPNKRPQPKTTGAANKGASPASDPRLTSGRGEQWFRNGRILGAMAGVITLMAVMWRVVNMQPPKPVDFPVTRATADEVDPSLPPPPPQPPAYDPN